MEMLRDVYALVKGAVAHEANFWAATRADVSNIQAANVPNVVMDQGMADVADFCSRQCAADRAAYAEAQDAARLAGRAAVASEEKEGEEQGLLGE